MHPAFAAHHRRTHHRSDIQAPVSKCYQANARFDSAAISGRVGITERQLSPRTYRD